MLNSRGQVYHCQKIASRLVVKTFGLTHSAIPSKLHYGEYVKAEMERLVRIVLKIHGLTDIAVAEGDVELVMTGDGTELCRQGKLARHTLA